MIRMKGGKLLTVYVAILLLSFAVLIKGTSAQTFGKNKVQYKCFDWSFIQTEHFDIYFYSGSEEIAEFVVRIAEDAYEQISQDFRYNLRKRVPIILYKSHNDFQQTNVITGIIEENVGGFTEYFKNRVVIPYEGSYEALRHVVYHELTHAVMFEMLYRGVLEAIATRQFRMPLWVAEGLAEFESLGWDTESDMYMRDATIAGYIPPLRRGLDGFLAYKGGQSIFRYIAQRYGRRKVGDILHKIKGTRNLENALKSAIGIGVEELGKDWLRTLKKEYWPEIARRDEPQDFAKQLTDHREDNSYFNIGPSFSPQGDKIAFLSDRKDYTDIYLMSAIDGKVLAHLVKGERSGLFESLHGSSRHQGRVTWNPQGDLIAFMAKSGPKDALYIFDIGKKKVKKKYIFDLDGMFSPSWALTGDRIAFIGLKDGMSDIYVVSLSDGTLQRLTHDPYDDADPVWSPDGKRMAFSSDRYPTDPNFPYGQYDIFVMNADGSGLVRVTQSPASDRSPSWSPDGRKIVYTSDANGIFNLYIADLDSSLIYPITNVLTGCFSPCWSPDGRKIAFTSFNRGGWDIYVLKDPLSHRKALKELAPTPFWAQRLKELEVAAGPAGNHPLGAQAPAAESPERPSLEQKYKVHRYKLKFSPDMIYGSLGYSTYYGLSGQTQIAVSDIFGNHRFYISTDMYYSLEESDFQVFYFYLPQRTDYGVGIFNFKNYYFSPDRVLFSDKNSGAILLMSRPFNKFQRLEWGLLWLWVTREYYYRYYYFYLPYASKRIRVFMPSLSLVNDTVLWGYTGPVNGSRSIFTIQCSPDIGFNDFSFTTYTGDYRRYLRFKKKYNLVLRLAAGASTGRDPQKFFLGGTSGWVWPRFARTDVFDRIEDFYLAAYQTPLRGYDYYELAGTKFVLLNLEFRYPLLQYLVMVWPLPVGIRNVRGCFFLDLGSAWDLNRDFKPFTSVNGLPKLEDMKAGYGFGARVNLSLVIIRFDIAWRTNFTQSSSGKPRYYLSLGAEF